MERHAKYNAGTDDVNIHPEAPQRDQQQTGCTTWGQTEKEHLVLKYFHYLQITNLDLKEQAKPKGFSDCSTVHSKVFISIEARHNVLMHS